MSRHDTSTHQPDESENTGAGPDGIEEFANEIDRAMRAASHQVTGSSALDPDLWEHIQGSARPKQRHDKRHARVSGRKSTPVLSSSPEHQRVSPFLPTRPGSTRQGPIPARKWHRGLASFLVVALTICAIVVISDRADKPQDETVVLQAPVIATPSPIDTEHCSVEPLTVDEVYSIAIDVSLTDRQGSKVLFPTQPPKDGDYVHTHTWLPEEDGTVRVGDKTVPTRGLLTNEFQDVEASLNRYLRCQAEGTNFQIWALESKVEVQRQIVQPLLQNFQGNQEITEPMLIDQIERLGPLPRQDEQYLAFITNRPPSNSLKGFKLEANPDIAAAFIANGTSDNTRTHAWIGSQLVNEETGDVELRRGASLGAPVPVWEDGSAVPMVGVFILIQEEGTGHWLVEWFIPSV